MILLNRIKNNVKGQGLVEYGLILALVSVVAVGSLGGVGNKVTDTFSTVENAETVAKIQNGYIPIASADELDNLRKNEEQTFGKGTDWEGSYESGLDKSYIQVADIDLSDIDNFEPIGTSSRPFTGEFDGDNFVIDNLNIDRISSDYIGLFGYVHQSLLNNITLEGVSIRGSSVVGGLVGYQNGSIVSDSSSTGNIEGFYGVGGLIGIQENSKIYNSLSKCNITGGRGFKNSQIGGLVGIQINSSVDSSYTSGKVLLKGRENGGLVGVSIDNSLINNSYSTSSVISEDGSERLGGLVGVQYRGASIVNSYAIGEVDSAGRTGGLVGSQHTNSNVLGSYYNTETTKQKQSSGGVGKSTEEMKDIYTYDGWSESVWVLKEGSYPKLKWQ